MCRRGKVKGNIFRKERFKDLNDSYVIFIYKHDKFGEKYPIYHVDRVVRETGKYFDDGSHIIYANGNYKGDDDMGRLMRDFHCKEPEKMHFKELAKGVKRYKQSEEGREMTCDSVKIL